MTCMCLLEAGICDACLDSRHGIVYVFFFAIFVSLAEASHMNSCSARINNESRAYQSSNRCNSEL